MWVSMQMVLVSLPVSKKVSQSAYEQEGGSTGQDEVSFEVGASDLALGQTTKNVSHPASCKAMQRLLLELSLSSKMTLPFIRVANLTQRAQL